MVFFSGVFSLLSLDYLQTKVVSVYCFRLCSFCMSHVTPLTLRSTRYAAHVMQPFPFLPLDMFCTRCIFLCSFFPMYLFFYNSSLLCACVHMFSLLPLLNVCLHTYEHCLTHLAAHVTHHTSRSTNIKKESVILPSLFHLRLHLSKKKKKKKKKPPMLFTFSPFPVF